MLLRILLWSLIVFVLLRFLWRMLRVVFKDSAAKQPETGPQGGDASEKKSVAYGDLQEAKFKDLPDDEKPVKDDREIRS